MDGPLLLFESGNEVGSNMIGHWNQILPFDLDPRASSGNLVAQVVGEVYLPARHKTFALRLA